MCSHSCRGRADTSTNARASKARTHDCEEWSVSVSACPVSAGRYNRIAVLTARPRNTMGKTSLAFVTADEMILNTKLVWVLATPVAVGSMGALSSPGSVPAPRDGTAMLAHTARTTAPPSRNNVADQPRSPMVMAALSNPADWEAVKKATTMAMETPLRDRAMATGRAPQEHRGVARPTSAARTLPLVRRYLLRQSRGNSAALSIAVMPTPTTTHGIAPRTSPMTDSKKLESRW